MKYIHKAIAQTYKQEIEDYEGFEDLVYHLSIESDIIEQAVLIKGINEMLEDIYD